MPKRLKKMKPVIKNGSALNCFSHSRAGIKSIMNITPSVRENGINDIIIAEKIKRLLIKKYIDAISTRLKRISVRLVYNIKRYSGVKIVNTMATQACWYSKRFAIRNANHALSKPQIRLNATAPVYPNCAKGDERIVNNGLPQWFRKNAGYLNA